MSAHPHRRSGFSRGAPMSFHRFIPVIGTLLVGAACGSFRGDPAVAVTAEDATLNSRWHANLASPANLAGAVQMNGSASMAPGSGGSNTTITLNLANASPGGIHPWAAHRGQCGAGMDEGLLDRARRISRSRSIRMVKRPRPLRCPSRHPGPAAISWLFRPQWPIQERSSPAAILRRRPNDAPRGGPARSPRG